MRLMGSDENLETVEQVRQIPWQSGEGNQVENFLLKLAIYREN